MSAYEAELGMIRTARSYSAIDCATPEWSLTTVARKASAAAEPVESGSCSSRCTRPLGDLVGRRVFG